MSCAWVSGATSTHQYDHTVSDHSFSALTDAVVSPVEGTHVLRCVIDFPRLGAALLWAASRDEAMIVEHLVNIGRRTAIERTAHSSWSWPNG